MLQAQMWHTYPLSAPTWVLVTEDQACVCADLVLKVQPVSVELAQ